MRELKQTKKAVSQRAYYLRLKERRAKKAAETDQAILDVVALNADVQAKADAAEKRAKDAEEKLAHAEFNVSALVNERNALKKDNDELHAELKKSKTNHINAVSDRNRQIVALENKLDQCSEIICRYRTRHWIVSGLAMSAPVVAIVAAYVSFVLYFR